MTPRRYGWLTGFGIGLLSLALLVRGTMISRIDPRRVAPSSPTPEAEVFPGATADIPEIREARRIDQALAPGMRALTLRVLVDDDSFEELTRPGTRVAVRRTCTHPDHLKYMITEVILPSETATQSAQNLAWAQWQLI